VVKLRTRVPASVAPGENIEYRITIENDSDAAAHQVTVRNPLPANARFVKATPEPSVSESEIVWRLGTLERCACKEITLVLAPTGSGEVRNCARVQFEHGQCVTTRIGGAPESAPPPRAAPGTQPRAEPLSLRTVGQERAVLYDEFTLHLFITNQSAADITGVVATVSLPPGLEHASGKEQLTFDVGTLAPGKTRHIEYRVIAKAGGRLCARAVVVAHGGIRQEATTCVQVEESKLEVSKTGPLEHAVQLPARYDITVNNPGSTPLTNVVIIDTLPEAMELVSASLGGKTVGKQTTWNLGTLPPRSKRTVQIVARALAAGDIRNVAVAAADRSPETKAEARTVFKGGAGLTFGIESSDDPVKLGSETTYVVTVVNQGNAPATKIGLTITIPENLVITRADPMPSKQVGQTLTYEKASLPGSTPADVRITVRAAKEGNVRIRAELTADLLKSGPVKKEASATIFGEAP
jgi:uncharacterized repeat protein (TIGR01451 family)